MISEFYTFQMTISSVNFRGTKYCLNLSLINNGSFVVHECSDISLLVEARFCSNHFLSESSLSFGFDWIVKTKMEKEENAGG